MERRLNIAFFWHMHQPLYKDPFTDEYILPWVLFHGTKDYYDMVAILDEFPEVHQTFNLVPSLKEASRLTPHEKRFILERFFQANHENMIRPLARYWEFLKKRGLRPMTVSTDPSEIERNLRHFTVQDFLDLQVLFNLVWIDPTIRQKDPFLSALYEKGKNYTEEEKRRLLSKQIEIIKWILPKYLEMKQRGIVELTTSPYYHPIMPLLCDTDSAKEAISDITLPKQRFMNPRDAADQLKRGLALHRETFGENPQGLWPPEGSVSMEILPLLKQEGISWIASDEDILVRSSGAPVLRDQDGNCKSPFLYRPYTIDSDGPPISIVFRDRVLSDLIGFEYCRWDPEEAAEDLVQRFMSIHGSLEEPQNHLVSIILDGENAWESYKNDGRDFFISLYSRLSNHPKLRCVRVMEFLEELTAPEKLPRLFSGSWINHNFKVWIGHSEENTAWDLIGEARRSLVDSERTIKATSGSSENIEKAWNEIHAAEGSDWFWWYGDEHASISEREFDDLFRSHLKKVYNLISMETPAILDIPIITDERGYRPPKLPGGFLNPVFDGEITNYYEWLAAGKLERIYVSGAMHREEGAGGGLIDGISYGFNLSSLFFRFDYLKELMPCKDRWSFTINFLHPKQINIRARIHGKSAKVTSSGGQGALQIASGDVVELAIPFTALGAQGGEEIRVFIEIEGRERGFERWPAKGFLIVDVPSEDFERQNWIV
jgi:alpha-amylase/alpha-mannosidase (GH57 family)